MIVDKALIKKKVLLNAGWSAGRDVFGGLIREKKEFLPDEVKKVISEYGLLKLNFEGQSGRESFYFDVDDSEMSKNLRADIFGYASYREIDSEKEPDFKINLDSLLAQKISENVGERCEYIGFIEDYLGFDVFISQSGCVYIAHGTTATKRADRFEEFLDKIILGE